MNDDRRPTGSDGWDDPCDEFVAGVDELLAAEGGGETAGRDAAGGAPAARERRARLAAHAAACNECGALLRLLRGLRAEDEAALSERVPARLAEAAWPRLEAALEAAAGAVVRPAAGAAPNQPPGPSRRPARRLHAGTRRRPRLVSLLAAALAVLVLAAGYLGVEVNRLRRQQASLESSLAMVTSLAAGAAAAGRAFEAASSCAAAAGPALALLRSEVTVGELVAWLGRQPPEAVVLDRQQILALSEQSARWRILVRQVRAAGLGPGEDLSAGEALRLLAHLDLDPRRRLPGRSLLRGGAPGATHPRGATALPGEEDRT